MIVVITDINIFDFGMGKGTYRAIYINISCIRIFNYIHIVHAGGCTLTLIFYYYIGSELFTLTS